MRKHRVSMLATYYADSKKLSWHVEQEVDGGVWTLVDEGDWDSSKLPSEMFAALLGALAQATADSLSSTNPSSDVG
jgi:hypothetical protein